MQGENLAAIDLGTNSCRIRITDKSGNVIYREAVTTKLGEGLAENMRFTPEAIERGLKCLTHFAELMKDYEVGHYRAVATASCRMAQNGDAFVQMVEEMSGIKLEVISAAEEAALTLKGAVLNADKSKPYVLVYDLGGGSTEITFATNQAEPQILYTISVPWGARNSSEVFDLLEYNVDNAAKLANEVKKYTRQFLQNSDYLAHQNECCCLATSSTPLRLLNMVENTGVYSKEYADGLAAPIEKIEQQVQKVFKMSLIDLMQNPYIGESRSSIFVAACVIFKTIYDELQIKVLTASLKGAQEALIEELGQKWRS
jgi:exopolyphosphatase/guanosine-5'-triphosphate,3'-diphosphate pyrophosphatase